MAWAGTAGTFVRDTHASRNVTNRIFSTPETPQGTYQRVRRVWHKQETFNRAPWRWESNTKRVGEMQATKLERAMQLVCCAKYRIVDPRFDYKLILDPRFWIVTPCVHGDRSPGGFQGYWRCVSWPFGRREYHINLKSQILNLSEILN